MSQPSLVSEFESAIFAFAWRFWGTLGVSSWETEDQPWCLDLEPTILFSLGVARREARMFDEILDWLCLNENLVSLQRLRNAAKAWPEEIQRIAFAAMALAAPLHPPVRPLLNGDSRWVPVFMDEAYATEAVQGNDPTFARFNLERPAYIPSQKSRRPDLRRPQNLGLRLREMVGVGTRAELFRHFLCTEGRVTTTRELASASMSVRRHVSTVLDSLERAGLCERHRLGERESTWSMEVQPWLGLLGMESHELPHRVDWQEALLGLWHLLDFLTHPVEGESPYLESSRARQLMKLQGPRLRTLGGWKPTDPTAFAGEAYLPQFRADVARLTKRIGQGTAPC